HDGIAQELALISRTSKLLEPSDAATEIEAAAVRGLADVREAIGALDGSPQDQLADVIWEEARMAAGVLGRPLDVEIEVPHDLELGNDRRATLLRITRDAVANAARDGEPPRIRIEVERVGLMVRLRVKDSARTLVEAAV